MSASRFSSSSKRSCAARASSATRVELGVALLDLRLEALQHHAQVALDAAQGLDLVRVVALARDAETMRSISSAR